jgi:hypothetical protein
VIRRLVLGPVMAIAASAAASGLLIVSSAQGATFNLGQVGTNHNCVGYEYTEIQTATGAPPRYEAPSDGTITSWSVAATSQTNVFVKLKMFRQTNLANFFTLIGESSMQGPLTPNMLNGPFTTSIPVKAGDLLALDVVAGSGLGCLFDTADTGDVAEEVYPDDSVVGDIVTRSDSFNSTRANIAATFDPQSPAPPGGQPTSHNKKCKKHKKKHKSAALIAKKCKKKHHQ